MLMITDASPDEARAPHNTLSPNRRLMRCQLMKRNSSSFWQRMLGGDSGSLAFDRDYPRVIDATAGMVRDGRAIRLAKQHKLNIVDLTWEDTGRFKGSAVGPNISDLTIQVQSRDTARDGLRLSCMPVIRFPNFSDRTADVALDEIFIRVGNERGGALRRIALREYLGNLRSYLSKPSSWKGEETSLLAERDRDVLVSAQACFLPVPKDGKAEFNPVLFNYQSYGGAPAVLAILATREGTSATIIDNARDGFSAGNTWGQRLFFNKNGERASFTGTRLEEFAARGGDAINSVASLVEAKKRGLNQVVLIQIPLVQPERRFRMSSLEGAMYSAAAAGPVKACKRSGSFSSERSDVDEAVIGHGEIEGPFTELDGLSIRRDARFPIRLTVQFYKATSNGVVSSEDMAELAQQIDDVYTGARAVGSLVTEGDTRRSTEWDDEGAGKNEPDSWWEDFWRTQEATTGRSREEMMRDLQRVLGYRPNDDELAAAILRVFGGHA